MDILKTKYSWRGKKNKKKNNKKIYLIFSKNPTAYLTDLGRNLFSPWMVFNLVFPC